MTKTKTKPGHAAKPPADDAKLSHINPKLWPFAVRLDSISRDPANARKRTQKNLQAIKASLQRFGQQKPIIVDQANIVRAGNGTHEAAEALGWEWIAVLPSNLTGNDLSAFGIADNRSGELSEWDDAVLAQSLNALKEDGFDLAEIGFDDKDLDKLLDDTPDADAGNELPPEKWLVIITCRDEADQVAFLEQMNSAGRECRALSA